MSIQNTGKYRPERNKLKEKNIFLQNREDSSELRMRQVIENDAIDSKYGFERIKDYSERTGYLLNMHSNEMLDEDKRLIACIDYYFMEEDGTRFKILYPFMPYFYILTKLELIHEVTQFLIKKYSGTIGKIEIVLKEDLDMPNHLIGLKQKYLKLSFFNQNDLIKVKKEISSVIRKNRDKIDAQDKYYKEMLTNTLDVGDSVTKKSNDHLENIMDIREHDVPYHVRVSIDLKIFCGSWYTIKCKGPGTEPPSITPRPDIIERPEPIVLAFDIETTKLPLKFPDANTDQIMMISYMIDGQGYLITNREIISADIDDFEYTPKPEFDGHFVVYNESNEFELLQKFFDHILDVRPHIFVTYNGDFFDWPFIERRAAVYDLDMKQEIGFATNKDGVYWSRPAIHMDCLCWVKRDSYLPIGSQGLKAVAKAKLRYDPVELDPEEMCPLAASQPQVLSNYSVSDAVATYYLYMQYVHPFIFALCTIIPCEPDEVLRKGSGTLCEALLMVEAFHAQIIFPNKQENVLNKLTDDGHLLHQETYVGGHVEALESGVFRADIPCRFRLVPDAITKLIDNIPKTLQHAIEVEECVPMDQVENLDIIIDEISIKLKSLKDHPLRLERPLIYHLDVGAMYPNIILTNRLQPCAIVNETMCASCDFNRPGAECQRNMSWMWRAEYMPATRNEYQRIQQQLETERFPPQFPGGSQRAFHQLNRQEQAELERKRLAIYCRRVYKKQKVTKVEERISTICQKENAFYVDAVRAFRDRRYEYKDMSKKAKQAVTLAVKNGNAAEIKSAKNREVLYDSLQLAHKCILNSFYGYVMRKGARWHSMEMAGIVCYTGANIIMRAREIVEQIGRPLELDTDGIWCILPASFPENFEILTRNEKKKKFYISYPNAVLNAMVKEHFTNDQYHELIDPQSLSYEKRSENTIFFEVDGPYRAMVLPASKEEGKKLKKRYAVFNFDGSLAELKGFEVKRRGELQLIKNFQSSVFESFLKGDTLESCYASVAQVADYWLDVLFSKGNTMPDSELFELISENRSMSKTLDEYEGQKSSSITTAKRLAEFLGDQMVKDAGLACRYVISKKPEGAQVTERAIPLVIFQAEPAVQKHYLRKWLKNSALNSIDIRDILDWSYYIERLAGAIQKIITIPAAMQGIPNPVQRIQHPDWLHKKILEKNDNFKQRRIDDMFAHCPKSVQNQIGDVEDLPNIPKQKQTVISVNTKRKRSDKDNEWDEEELDKTWREILGNPPIYGTTKEEHVAWITFQKRKWKFQECQRNIGTDKSKRKRMKTSLTVLRSAAPGTLGGFLQKSQRAVLASPWQVLQIASTNIAGEYKLWALIQSELYQLRLMIPRIFYANLRTPKQIEEGALFKKCNRTLPRSKPVYNLYMYSIPEDVFQEHGSKLCLDQTDPNVEGLYETQVSPLFRAMVQIGCICKVKRGVTNLNTFSLEDLDLANTTHQQYLPKDSMKYLYLYNHKHPRNAQQMFALFLTPSQKALIIVVDSVRNNLMPNMNKLYQNEREKKKEKNLHDPLPPDTIEFHIQMETNLNKAYDLLQKTLRSYKDEKKGPTILAIQAITETSVLEKNIPIISEFPQTKIHVQDLDELYNVLEWQKKGATALIRHYLNIDRVLTLMTEQCRYFHIPIGNLPSDTAVFGADLFYARHLIRHNHILWCSSTDRPDLGGSQDTDARLCVEQPTDHCLDVCNRPGWYTNVCVELDVDSLAINTVLQAHHVADIEGTSAATAFDAASTASLEEFVGGGTTMPYDGGQRCAEAFRILRTMVAGWMRDISLYRNVFADFQAVHFYRWLRSTKAMLYDPALLRTLENLMKKLFLQLIAEFKRLGCEVIHANFNKIVVCTKRKSSKDAIANMEFVAASIRNRELFHSLEIEVKQCWELLVWLDVANFAGILAGKENEEHEGVGEDEDNNKNTVVTNWNIAEILPEHAGCRDSFDGIIADYIHNIHKKLGKNRNNIRLAPIQSQPTTGLASSEDIAHFANELLSNKISQKLYQLTEYIHTRLKLKSDGISPALDFIKAVCHIFGLDPAVKETVDNLKSDLLRLIGVGEFSDKAQWKDEMMSYVISQFICKACNHCRDIDLGRDPHRSENAWLCSLCNTPYDNGEIELLLLEIISKKFLTYNLQDLQCKKCGQIKQDNLSIFCKCAGNYQCIVSKTDCVKLLNIFLDLGDRYDMPSLKEHVEQCLRLI